jgi:ankyrin repeat protein
VLHYLVAEAHLFELEIADANGCTPLHWACVAGAYQALRYLLANGANPNAVQTAEANTPLQLAVKYMDETREVRTLHKLLIYGADIEIPVTPTTIASNQHCFDRTRTG